MISPEKTRKFTSNRSFYSNVSTKDKNDNLLVKFEERSGGRNTSYEYPSPSLNSQNQKLINFGAYELFLLVLTQCGYLPVAASLLSTTFFEPQKNLCHQFSIASNATSDHYTLNALVKKSKTFRSIFYEFINEQDTLGSLCAKAATLNFRLTFAIMLGGICGSFASGYLADRWGRKPVTVGTLILLAFANLTLIIFAPGGFYTALSIFFLKGLACGGYMVTNIVFILEAIKSQRTRLLVASLNGWPIGMVFTGFVGWLCTDWRTYAACVSGTATSLSFLLHSRSFESVGWLNNRSKLDKAEQIRRRIQKQNERLQLPKNLSFRSFETSSKLSDKTPDVWERKVVEKRLLSGDEIQVERELDSDDRKAFEVAKETNGDIVKDASEIVKKVSDKNGTIPNVISDQNGTIPKESLNGTISKEPSEPININFEQSQTTKKPSNDSPGLELKIPDSLKDSQYQPKSNGFNSVSTVPKPTNLNLASAMAKSPLPTTTPSELATFTQLPEKKKKSQGYLDLFKHSAIRRPLLALLFSFMTSSVVSFGFYFTADSMSGSRYLNLALMGVLKFSLGLLPFALSYLVSKKRIILLSVGFGSIACWFLAVSCTWFNAMESFVTTALGLFITASMDPTWKVSHLYSVELFPTGVRNMARGVCNVTARLGSMAGPLIILFRTYNPVLPYWLFATLLTLQLIVLYCFMPKETNNDLTQEMPPKSIEIRS